jgi:transcriptional regulator with GAF, ATPase, and Fis domain
VPDEISSLVWIPVVWPTSFRYLALMKLEALQAVAVGAAEERTVERVLERIVRGLADQPGVALARVWLIGPGDICATCPMRAECPEQTRCLHLAASAGRARAAPAEDWSRTDGAFRRFPLGVRKIGRIGATGEAVWIADVAKERGWIARPEWASAEEIRSFAGQPLTFRGEVLGALALFSRTALGDTEFAWLRIFADHAAVAIANSRALDEIARLREQLELENAYLRDEVKAALRFGEIIGRSGALQKALRQVELVAPTDAGVLITGESGTGKELFARAIHERSGRRGRPLITVNCGAIPHDLFESEFFGPVKGAFTGAFRDRVGRFQLADRGTIFLDEVGEIPLELQTKLLRVLQDGQFEPVGDDRTRTVAVRLIAATNRDLRADVEAGRFRRDLYYRLSVFPIEVPPLRDRAGDVALLAKHFATLAARRLGVPAPRLLASEVRRLEDYDWPGNIRELEHVVERAVILSRGAPLRFDLDPDPRGGRRRAVPDTAEATDVAILTEAELKQRARQNLHAALRQSRGRIRGPGGAAELLGMKPTTLAARLRALGITGPAPHGPSP